jgi:hypothetical protein
VRGEGVSTETFHSEPSLIIWGITREVALQIGKKAQQDAIFEISAETISIVDCETGFLESHPRHT